MPESTNLMDGLIPMKNVVLFGQRFAKAVEIQTLIKVLV